MRVSVEKTSELERRLTIVVPGDEFESEVDSNLVATRRQVSIPGFRPGKVPLKEVRRRLGAIARAETAKDVMRERFSEAVAREELTPVGTPALEIQAFDPGADFEFTATFEVFPPVELADFSTFEIVKPTCEITEADIDDMVQRLREQHRQWDAVERGAEEGDRITLDCEATLDGEPVEAAARKNVYFRIGSGQMIEAFDQAVRGLAAGAQKTFSATFPENYPNSELAGKTPQFSVSIISVEAPWLPELDEEFFREFDVEEGGIQAFREGVLGNMRRELDIKIRARLRRRVMDQLVESHRITLPQTLVDQEINVAKDRLQQLVQRGRAPLSLPDDLFREQAEQRVALGLISREIIRVHGLTPDSKRIRRRIEELAEPYADSDAVIDWYYQSEEELTDIEVDVLKDQVVDMVLDQAEVRLRECAYADIMADESPEQTREAERNE